MLTTVAFRTFEQRRHRPGSAYVWQLPITRYLQEFGKIDFRSPVTFFAGENGAGKSTLLEAIALSAGFSGRGGPLQPEEVRGTNTESELSHWLALRFDETLLRGYYLRNETHFDLLRDEATRAAGRNNLARGVDLMKRSHGESVFDVLGEYVDGRGLYLMDEPEAGLSVIRQMALLAEIDQAVQRGAQFLIATHSPILLGTPGAQILQFDDFGVQDVAYRDTDAYRATQEFIEAPEAVAEFLTRPELDEEDN